MSTAQHLTGWKRLTMTPRHGSGSPDDHPAEHNQTDPTTPVPLPRTPRTGRLRSLRLTLRRPRPARPSTVWPCAQDDHLGDIHTGSTLIASWLLTAVVKIVTTYTQPGDRVLLLTPATFGNSTVARPPAGVRTRTAPDPYAGLLEAAWTVVRLGRGIQTQTAEPPPDTIDSEHAVNPKSESGPRPHLTSLDPYNQHRRSPAGRPDPDGTTSTPGPDRFDLVITAAEPRTLDWLQPIAWADTLTPTGTLAVITRSDHTRGRLNDPARPLVTAAHHAGLRYHDRVALLRVPVRNGALAIGTGSSGLFRPPHKPMAITVRHTQVHDDLLVFTHRPTGVAASRAAMTQGESSDV